jgi:hypothetical protein
MNTLFYFTNLVKIENGELVEVLEFNKHSRLLHGSWLSNKVYEFMTKTKLNIPENFESKHKFSFIYFDQNKFSFYKHDYKNVIKFLEESFFSPVHYTVAEVSNTVTDNLIARSNDLGVFYTLEEAQEYARSFPGEDWDFIIIHDGENTY